MLWSKKPPPVHDRTRVIGLDLTASRARAVSVGGGKVRPVLLEDPSEEMPMFLACERRTPEVGRTAYALIRKMPHAVGSNFVPAVGQPREIRAGRYAFSPDACLELAFTRLRIPIIHESDSIALVVPAYLAPNQITRLVELATKARLPLKGTASAPLAVAAHRAGILLNGKPQPSADKPPPSGWVVPMRAAANGPGSVLIVDADEFALSATAVMVERDSAKLIAPALWPRVAVKAWKDKLLDAVSDRCVRLCRRDPRDSAEAEQSLFEQLDDALDRTRAGQRVSLTVRTAHWYQDLLLQPDELEGYCSALAQVGAEAIRELIAGQRVPPRAVWLTHSAGRLPGLGLAIQQNTPEGTAVEVLPAGAVAHAAAALVPRWLNGELPRTHLDAVIPFPAIVSRDAESAERSAAPRSPSARG
ncbi:MAG TPA: hypothetical protein VGL71_06670 [Urbifossiella sp.]